MLSPASQEYHTVWIRRNGWYKKSPFPRAEYKAKVAWKSLPFWKSRDFKKITNSYVNIYDTMFDMADQKEVWFADS